MLSMVLHTLPLHPPSPPPYRDARPRLCPPRSPPPLVSAASSSGGRSEDNYHTTLKALNSKGRRTPRKSLGQHYMLNSSVNELLCDVAGVGDGDVVLEVGPGTGSLTSVLMNAGATVIAVEKDPHMAMLVKDRFGCTDQLLPLALRLLSKGALPVVIDAARRSKIVKTSESMWKLTYYVLQEDFTRCHIRSKMSSLLDNKKSMGSELEYAKVVSNIPFNISTDVIKQLLPMGDIFSDVVLLLQDEAALRLADFSLRTSEYRPINLFVNFYSNPEYKCKVERTNFFPQPNVDAAVVRFKLKQVAEYPLVSSTKSFFSLVNAAFNSKRKMLRRSLQHICPSLEVEAALSSVGLPVTARPEELTLDDFVTLHNLITKDRAL